MVWEVYVWDADPEEWIYLWSFTTELEAVRYLDAQKKEYVGDFFNGLVIRSDEDFDYPRNRR